MFEKKIFRNSKRKRQIVFFGINIVIFPILCSSVNQFFKFFKKQSFIFCNLNIFLTEKYKHFDIFRKTMEGKIFMLIRTYQNK